MPSNHLILCRPLLLLPSIFPSIRVFSNQSVLHIGWPKYWSFSFSISPSNEYSGLISFRMDWLDLLAVQGTPKSLLQHHSPKASFFSAHSFHIEPSGSICACVISHFSRARLFVTPLTVAHQAPLSVGFSRQEYLSGLPCSPPGDLPDSGAGPASLYLLHWQAGSLSLHHLRSPLVPGNFG